MNELDNSEIEGTPGDTDENGGFYLRDFFQISDAETNEIYVTNSNA